MRISHDLLPNTPSRSSLQDGSTHEEEILITDLRGRMTPSEGVDRKLRVALRRASSFVFQSPVWPVEFDDVAPC